MSQKHPSAAHRTHGALCLSMLLVFVSAATACGQERSVELLETRGADSNPATTAERLYSGPQPQETLTEAVVWVVTADDQPPHKVDLAEISRQHPTAVMFMHEKSRPAFQLARMLSSFAVLRKDSKLQLYLVVLSDDRSASELWLKQIGRYFEAPTHLAVAEGGMEGPGSLGLNRLVDVSLFTAKDGVVTASFALTQVSAASDAASILTAINEIAGGGDIPSLEDLLPSPQAAQRAQREPPK